MVIYRLITCGTVEEKIYRKQVFKKGLSIISNGTHKDPFRYFTKQDLRDLFTATFDGFKYSHTHKELERMHGPQRTEKRERERRERERREREAGGREEGGEREK